MPICSEDWEEVMREEGGMVREGFIKECKVIVSTKIKSNKRDE